MNIQFTVVAALGALTMAAFPAHAQAPAAPPGPRQTPPASAGEVTVTGTRPGVTTSIDSRAYLIDRDLGASTGTLADALRNVPSVQVDIEGNVSLRGDSNVQILVDGKPSPMFVGPSRGQALQSFPAKDNERVEVMTTPSAAYSPENSGGIINLITKNPNRGMTTASVNAQYGSAGATRFSGNYTRRAGKLTITASANRNNDINKQFRTVARSATPNPATAPLDSATNYVTHSDQISQFANLNVTYDATPKLQLGANVTDGHVSVEAAQESQYRSFTAGAPVRAFDTVTTAPNLRVNIFGYGTTATRKFDGQDHDLSATYNFARVAQFVPIQDTITQILPPGAVEFQKTFNGFVTRQDKFRLNYKRPLPAGAKLVLGYDLQKDDNDYDASNARGASFASAITDPNLSRPFAFEQRINSIYSTFERPIGALTAQVGLRLEATDMKIAGVERDYTGAYPTLNFGYKLDDSNNLRGGYSRRIQRPNPTQLNPFRSQAAATALTFNEGNPDLQPQETDSYEFGYQYRKGQTSYLATLYWRVADGEFTQVTRDLGGGVTLTRPENLGSSRSGGVELVANGRLTSTLKYSLSTNTFWKEIEAGNLGFTGARSAIGVSGNANLSWDATANDALQLNAIATGKRLTAQGYGVPYWTLNFGWRHKFDNSLAATLTLRDLLDATRYKTVIDTPTLRSVDTNRQVSARAAIFQLTYTFGASKPADPNFDFGSGGGGGLGN